MCKKKKALLKPQILVDFMKTTVKIAQVVELIEHPELLNTSYTCKQLWEWKQTYYLWLQNPVCKSGPRVWNVGL